MSQSVRRVVTGHDAEGRSVILFDGPAPNAVSYPPGSGGCFTKLWATNRTPACNRGDKDAGNGPISIEPAPGGTGFFVAHIPPFDEQEISSALTEEEIAKLRAQAALIGAEGTHVESERDPSMHRTKTLDYLVLLAGEITLTMDKGDVVLKPFDVVIQRGTSHTWRNTGTTEAILLAVMIDAEPL